MLSAGDLDVPGGWHCLQQHHSSYLSLWLYHEPSVYYGSKILSLWLYHIPSVYYGSKIYHCSYVLDPGFTMGLILF